MAAYSVAAVDEILTSFFEVEPDFQVLTEVSSGCRKRLVKDINGWAKEWDMDRIPTKYNSKSKSLTLMGANFVEQGGFVVPEIHGRVGQDAGL